MNNYHMCVVYCDIKAHGFVLRMFKRKKPKTKTQNNPTLKTLLFLGCCVQLTKIGSKSCFAILRIKQFKKTNLVRLAV